MLEIKYFCEKTKVQFNIYVWGNKSSYFTVMCSSQNKCAFLSRPVDGACALLSERFKIKRLQSYSITQAEAETANGSGFAAH